jgi:hypothetical protein
MRSASKDSLCLRLERFESDGRRQAISNATQFSENLYCRSGVTKLRSISRLYPTSEYLTTASRGAEVDGALRCDNPVVAAVGYPKAKGASPLMVQ